jgi:hypothetical protein
MGKKMGGKRELWCMMNETIALFCRAKEVCAYLLLRFMTALCERHMAVHLEDLGAVEFVALRLRRRCQNTNLCYSACPLHLSI